MLVPVLQRMAGRAQQPQRPALEVVVVAVALVLAVVLTLAVRRFGNAQGISSTPASMPEELPSP